MVGHEAVRQPRPPVLPRYDVQLSEQEAAIPIVEEDRAAAVTAQRDVVDGAFELDP